MKMVNYLFNFKKFIINKALLEQSLNEYLQLKMESLLGSTIWYSITICIDSIQIRPNSSRQIKYHSYLLKSMSKLIRK